MNFMAKEIIRKKRDGQHLSTDEIEFMVRGLSSGGQLTEGQIAAFAMAVFFQGLEQDEQTSLTLSMRDSGSVLDWSSRHLPGPVIDKHSTGGVGDKVSLMLAPVLAACGAYVPMIAGRGLGHTGGTLDKLDAIPGYQTQPDKHLLMNTVQLNGCAISGQTADLAPADRTLYGIRDVTGTVESIPLITASILSKKLAAGLDGLVMDIKCGNGAFCTHPRMAYELADQLTQTGNAAGLPVSTLITDMNQVLGTTAGNSLEVKEAISYLKCEQQDPGLHQVVTALAAEMLLLSGLSVSKQEALQQISSVLESGKALEHFARMVCLMGGPADLTDNPEKYLDLAPVIKPCFATRTGFIHHIDTRETGLLISHLGGSRLRQGDSIDYRTGISNCCSIGSQIDNDRPIALIHAASESDAEYAAGILRQAIQIREESISGLPVVIDTLSHERQEI